MSDLINKKEYHEILDKLKTGDLSAEENKKLTIVLQSAEGRSEFYKNCLFTSALQEVLNEDPNSIEVIKKVHNSSTSIPIVNKKTYRSKKSLYTTLSGIAALLLLGLFFVFQYQTKDAFSPPIATVSLVNNTAWVQRESIKFKAAKGYSLKPGDTLITENKAIITFTYKDNSTIDLGPNTKCVLSNNSKNKTLLLQTGKLYADIKPQVKPMTLYSNNAITTVHGTRFTLENIKNESQLKLSKGRVSFMRTSDHALIHLQAGQQISSVDQNTQPFHQTTMNEDAKFASWDDKKGILTVLNNEKQTVHFILKDSKDVFEKINESNTMKILLKQLVHGDIVKLTYQKRAFLELRKIRLLRSNSEL